MIVRELMKILELLSPEAEVWFETDPDCNLSFEPVNHISHPHDPRARGKRILLSGKKYD